MTVADAAFLSATVGPGVSSATSGPTHSAAESIGRDDGVDIILPSLTDLVADRHPTAAVCLTLAAVVRGDDGDGTPEWRAWVARHAKT